MLKEIHEQPNLVRGLAAYYLEGDGIRFLEEMNKVHSKRFMITACGTSYYAGMIVGDIIERFNRISLHGEFIQ